MQALLTTAVLAVTPGPNSQTNNLQTKQYSDYMFYMWFIPSVVNAYIDYDNTRKGEEDDFTYKSALSLIGFPAINIVWSSYLAYQAGGRMRLNFLGEAISQDTTSVNMLFAMGALQVGVWSVGSVTSQPLYEKLNF